MSDRLCVLCGGTIWGGKCLDCKEPGRGVIAREEVDELDSSDAEPEEDDE